MDEKNKYCLFFLHIGKTAGSSLNSFLELNFKNQYLQLNSFLFDQYLSEEQIKTVVGLHNDKNCFSSHIFGHPLPETYNNKIIKSFTFLRHPASRAFSHYFYFKSRVIKGLVKKNMAFDNFEKWYKESWRIDKKNNNQQSYTLHPSMQLEEIIRYVENRDSFVGITEKFDISLILLCDWLRKFNFKVQPKYVTVNRTKDILNLDKEKEYVQNNFQELVLEDNQNDLNLYNYFLDKIKSESSKSSKNIDHLASKAKKASKNIIRINKYNIRKKIGKILDK
tara:strand:+ start:2714 stop:3550 length:837 start_codon:yes stop_codon:yes gene_type:complete